MTAGAWVLLATVAAALAFGVYRAYADGRFRGTHAVRGADEAGGRADTGGRGANPEQTGGRGANPEQIGGRVANPEQIGGRVASAASVSRPGEPDADLLAALDGDLGTRATLVQFSSAFCAPCRATRRVLGDVAQTVPGVVHHEIDAEHHLDLVRRLKVLRTPTTLVLDDRGVEVARASGAPTKAQVVAQLGALA
jgi:thiol-disulfide isomerase/thioredoxin